jgi:hypothetical protein
MSTAKIIKSFFTFARKFFFWTCAVHWPLPCNIQQKLYRTVYKFTYMVIIYYRDMSRRFYKRRKDVVFATGVRCAHFPSVITTIINHKAQLLITTVGLTRVEYQVAEPNLWSRRCTEYFMVFFYCWPRFPITVHVKICFIFHIIITRNAYS